MAFVWQGIFATFERHYNQNNNKYIKVLEKAR